jgi:hypothetical protein
MKLNKDYKYIYCLLIFFSIIINFIIGSKSKKNKKGLKTLALTKVSNSTIPIKSKKNIIWTTSMYSVHRNWLNRRENNFKTLNSIVEVNKYKDNDS